MKVALVVPVYNEKNTILKLVNTIKDYTNGNSDEIEIAIVDDNSPDGTANIIRELASKDDRVHPICRPRKMGLGSAYVDAFRWILNNSRVDVVIQMDGDMSHPPALLHEMIDRIKMGADAVIASRYSENGGVYDWPLHRRIISKSANLFVKMLLGLTIKDVTSGYRAFRMGVIEELLTRRLSSTGYEFQVESIHIISKMNKKIEEVPFVFSNRREGKSKLSSREILRFVSTVLALKLKTLTKTEERNKLEPFIQLPNS